MSYLHSFRPYAAALILVLFAGLSAGCAAEPLPQPQELVCPTPLSNNSGSYMSPYTSDGVLAKWVDKAVAAKGASDVGGAVGGAAAAAAMRQVPFVGGILGDAAGKEIGKDVAIAAAGGADFMRSSSDLSFNNINDLAVFMYCTHASSADYPNVFAAVCTIYPELTDHYDPAIRAAPKQAVAAAVIPASSK